MHESVRSDTTNDVRRRVKTILMATAFPAEYRARIIRRTRSRSSPGQNSSSSFLKPFRATVKYSSMTGHFRKTRIPPGRVIQSDVGREIRSWLRLPDLRKARGWTTKAIQVQELCTSQNDSIGRISDTWMSRSQSAIRRLMPNPGL